MANTGKRERNRIARHSELLAAAGAIVTEKGLDGLTMQELAQRVDCAVGTIYTYFSSKSALLAALQADAIRVLARSYESAASQWDDALEADEISERVASLTRMVATGRLFVNWQGIQPREFDFLQMLSMSPERLLTPKDVAAVLPLALTLFAEARVIHDEAVRTGALHQDLDQPGDDGTARTVRWIAALDGAILVGNATAGVTGDLDPGAFDQYLMTDTMTADFLTAWGASKEELTAALEVTNRMAVAGTLLPEALS